MASFGVVSRAGGPWRSLRGGEIDARIELDLRLRRSAEGGIALETSGAAYGMAVFGPRRRVLVIPAATIERVADKLASHGRIPRGYLGLGLHQVRLTGADGMGAMVMSVDPNGPGAAAGVHQGDVIVTFNGEPIRRVQSLLRALGPDLWGRRSRLIFVARRNETALADHRRKACRLSDEDPHDRSGLRSTSRMGRSPIGLLRCLRACPVCASSAWAIQPMRSSRKRQRQLSRRMRNIPRMLLRLRLH